MDAVQIIALLNKALAVLLFVCCGYQFLYLAVPLVRRQRAAAAAAVQHRYAVLIAARNEAAVLPQLLATLRAQDYPRELFTVFVMADNCTDATAALAKEGGAEVYARTDTQQVGKGYALQALLEAIRRDWGPDAFDGCLVFDADNLLAPDYITRMNESFAAGCEIVTGYRNSKNYSANWISAGYGLWFLREAEYLNRPRALLGTSCGVSGTGFLFSKAVLEAAGGWPYHLLTEDIQFTAANVLAGRRVGYCRGAVLYDEQPVTFGQSWRQRMRWAKGYIQVLRGYGRRLLAGAVRGVKPAQSAAQLCAAAAGVAGQACSPAGGAAAGESARRPAGAPTPLQRRWSCWDMVMSILPAFVFTAAGLVLAIAEGALALAAGQGVWAALAPTARLLAASWLVLFALGGITTAGQWSHIPATAAQKLLYTFTFPFFMLTYIPISFAALFCRVEWKPIHHTAALTLEQVREECRR